MEEKQTSSSKPPEISVIIPAYNEASVIPKVIRGINEVLKNRYTFEVLVIDDGSDDNTGELAAAEGACVISHPYNIGNGAAVKTGIRQAKGAIVVMMDGDGQHNPKDIPRLLEMMQMYDMVVGARSHNSETAFHRDLANIVYNLFASYICHRKIFDLTSGFRAIKADIAKDFVYLLPNTFSYPSTITLAILRSGYSLTYIPIETKRRVGKSKIRLLHDGIRFLTIILRVAVFFAPLRIFIPISSALFLFGFVWYLYRFSLTGTFSPAAILFILTSVITFSLGLISEQIAQLRYERTERI